MFQWCSVQWLAKCLKGLYLGRFHSLIRLDSHGAWRLKHEHKLQRDAHWSPSVQLHLCQHSDDYPQLVNLSITADQSLWFMPVTEILSKQLDKHAAPMIGVNYKYEWKLISSIFDHYYKTMINKWTTLMTFWNLWLRFQKYSIMWTESIKLINV